MKYALFFFVLVFLSFLTPSDAAICCPNGCFIDANCCAPDGNGYVGCQDTFGTFHCPSTAIFDPYPGCPECEACLTCQCSDPVTCSWVGDDTLCGPGEVCDFLLDPVHPEATQCIAGNCPLCEDCGTGFTNICDIDECHQCEFGECYFESPLLPACSHCSTATQCSDFNDDQQACNGEVPICDSFSCYWDDVILGNDCKQCDASVQCEDYENEETCNLNPCHAEDQCWWITSCGAAPNISVIIPNPGYVLIDQEVTYTVIGNYSDGSTIDITNDASFSSDNPLIAVFTDNRVQGIAAGTVTVRVAFKDQEKFAPLHVGEADQDPLFCELGLAGIQGNCTATGDTWCWDTNATTCCGDDGDENYLNAINHSCSPSELFNDKVVYQTDPDDSSAFCDLMSLTFGGAVLPPVDCNAEGEKFCWADSNFITQDGACCGDDEDETWSYSTSLTFDRILVDGTCYQQEWVERSNYAVTYYDLWPLEIS